MKTNTIEKDISGSYRTPDGKAQIDFGITYRNGYPEYTSTGHYDGSSGQCVDDIGRAYPNDPKVQELWRAHTAHHLESVANHPAFMEKVKRNSEAFPAVSFYETQAQDFLSRNGLKFRAVLSDSKSPAWAKEGEETGHHYRCMLWRVNDRRSYTKPVEGGSRLTFDFWGSIADARENKHPSAYDVLACISSDAYTPETFEDFCAEYGYESDSIKALQQFRRCDRFAKRLRAFFTSDELTQLSEIQ